MLKFDSAWRFDSPGNIPQGVVNEFSTLIGKIAFQGGRKTVFEHFKHYFAGASGNTSSYSSSESWAESDLDRYMSMAANNAPLFIEAFYDACEDLKKENPDLAIPPVTMINKILSDNNSGYQINFPLLTCLSAHAPISVSAQQPSIDEQAQEMINRSLAQSERFLSEGQNRAAVQEVLWLLETISTAFRGLEVGTSTVQGKYFNKIAEELRKHHKGQILEQVLNWITALHGYLSSPTGGGVRHGSDIKLASDMRQNEARLFCNLIRSYISFLVAEHARLSNFDVG